MNNNNNIHINNIRNFCIIAHIDHGKSTLSNQLIKFCTNKNNSIGNILDSMELEKKKGITIKSKYIGLLYKNKNILYKFNLIDTPGHVDFSDEVNKSFLSCEGALLLVDAHKGIQAQTIFNYKKSILNKLKIIPVINKIDLKNINLNLVSKNLENMLQIEKSDIIYCSSKLGFGIKNIIKRIIKDIPSPKNNQFDRLHALIIDSWFENYFGIISIIRIKKGVLNKGDIIKIVNSNFITSICKIGLFNPNKVETNSLRCGEIGWISFSTRDIFKIKPGYSLILKNNNIDKPIIDFKKESYKLYFDIYPCIKNEYNLLYNSIIKLSINDSSLFYEKTYSEFLGYGIKCGFLGLLHLDIVKSRLKTEYKINFIITNSSIIYEVYNKNKDILYINSIEKFPNRNEILEIREPIVKCVILTPSEYLNKIINLCIKSRGNQINIDYKDNYLEIIYEIPMIEIISDFFDRIKSISNGYASFNYKFLYFKKSNLVFIDVLINKNKINLLSTISHINSFKIVSKNILNKLISIISRHQFNVKIQILVNNKIIFKHVIKQFKKNVSEKCGGGDINRKKKLINKQKLGKKKMSKKGIVNINKSLIKSIFSID